MLALILAGIGTFGIAGFIALAIFAPPIAAAVAKGALGIVSTLWQTRLGMAAMVGTAAFFAGAALGDWKGAARVQAKWDAAETAAIARGGSARSEAETEIPLLAPEDGTPATPPDPPPLPKYHIPFLKPPEAHHECPPPRAAAACPRIKRRPVDRMLRSDPDNRDNR